TATCARTRCRVRRWIVPSAKPKSAPRKQDRPPLRPSRLLLRPSRLRQPRSRKERQGSASRRDNLSTAGDSASRRVKLVVRLGVRAGRQGQKSAKNTG